MCATCGCSDDAEVRIVDPAGHDHEHRHAHGHEHAHGHGHGHEHDHKPGDTRTPEQEASRTVVLEQEVLAKNNLLAERNRGWLEGRDVFAVNLMSSPGAGKTTLLEQTIADLGTSVGVGVVEGDQETLLDAQRVQATGAQVVQINTGAGCHLDADMLRRGLRQLDPAASSVVFIENVGNLVCPALFDLGERARVVIMSVTEGADKPLKYPHMFRAADLVLLNKIDLAPYVDFDTDACADALRRTNPAADVLEVSATRGDGLTAWYEWLTTRHGAHA